MSKPYTIVITGDDASSIREELEASYSLMLRQFPNLDWGIEAGDLAMFSMASKTESVRFIGALANLAATELRLRALQRKSGQDN